MPSNLDDASPFDVVGGQMPWPDRHVGFVSDIEMQGKQIPRE